MRSRVVLVTVLLLFCVGIMLGSLGACGEESNGEATLGSIRFNVRVLNTRTSRRDALLSYGAADPFVPLLIAYPHDRIHHYHTELLPRAFDVVFISTVGTIVDQQPLPRTSEEGITSAQPAAHALILPEGQWARSGAAVGQTITLPPISGTENLRAVSFVDKAGVVLHVETALSLAERKRGLMYRTGMSDGEGMVFKHPSKENREYWMRNTKIPLSIAYFNEDGRIVKIHSRMEPLRESPKYESGVPVQYVLEVNVGWFEKQGIKEGTVVVLDPEILDARATH